MVIRVERGVIQKFSMPTTIARPLYDFKLSSAPVAAALLCIPIALIPVMGYETNPVFLLVPFVAYSYLTSLRSPLNIAFALAVAGGAVSILSHEILAPDGQLLRHTLGLILLLIAPSFLFLGRRIGKQGLRKLVFWLAIASSVFIIPATIELLVAGEAVRGVTDDDYSYLNVRFFGLPMAYSFGVNSAAPLFCFQAAILCGAIMSTRNWCASAGFLIALSCAIFIVLGSNSRTTQLALLLLAVAATFFVIINPRRRWVASLTAVSLTAVMGVASVGGTGVNRFIDMTDRVVLSMQGAAGGQSDHQAAPKGSKIDDLTTGRFLLATAAARQTLNSPITGNGFSSFDRYASDPLAKPLRDNSTTHLYYLTLIWKGGLLFFLPFVVFIGLAIRRAWRAMDWRSPESFFPAVAVALALGPFSLTWDLLMVPSAGALAWFLLGALGRQGGSRFHRSC